ncbi:acyltransferase family protein [Nocardia brasiliensis]|uniref:Acyltransferase family protein n=1 Tax=Nocardia brasiliensis TaxID=37326 RepID=A0A6G9XU61_NOCBR|nr:acyltransferase family protein [Nocardia brasiliensis]QIS04390.1 acyltransferase family protein [Nocardia brasiliensis]
MTDSDAAATVTGDSRVAPPRTIAPADPVPAPADTVRAPSDTARYRRDLDGLRGVAIALVVVFHVWFGKVSGGVDVFLVLSGFFFTGMVLRRAESGATGVVWTVRRTARRLYPALLVVLAAVLVATAVMRPYTQWSDIVDQALASVLYYQNWNLALSWADYLAADPSVSPLQHLWSMSVQTQFYLAILLMIAMVAAVCRSLGYRAHLRLVLASVLGGLAAMSLVYATLGVAHRQGWNYYDSGARAWELLVGALLAIAVPWLRPHRALRWVLAVFGTAAVLLCGVFFDGANSFPGPAALFPVAAAAALIVAGNGLEPAARPLPSRLLGSRPMVVLGELAYPLYLWHWPILIFVLTERGTSDIGLADGTVVIGVSLVLAYLTHHLVEEPLRTRTAREPVPRAALVYRRGAGVAVALVGLGVVGVGFGWHVVVRANPPRPVGVLDAAHYPGAEALASGAEVPEARMRPTVFEAPAEAAYPSVDGCIADWLTRDVITCSYGDVTASRTIAVTGSSHAEHWVPALDLLGKEHQFRVEVYLKMGCPLTIAEEVSYKGEPNPDCRDWSRDVIDRLGEDRPDWVFTTSTRPRDGAGDETPPEYLDVWSALSDRNLKLLAMRDTPWLRRNGIRYRGIDCLAHGGDRISCGMKRSDALDAVDPAAAPAASFPHVFPLDLTDAVCEPEVCPIVEGNILIYHDEHHLTASYSRSLAPELARRLQPILGWW